MLGLIIGLLCSVFTILLLIVGIVVLWRVLNNRPPAG